MKPRTLNSLLTIFLSLSVCGIFSVAYFYVTRTQPVIQATPEQKATKLKKETEFQRVVLGAILLKTRMKNPDSFKLETATMMKSGFICYEYRATNSFNAVVPGTFVVASKVASQEAKDWNKYCAGQSGTDYTSARQAL